MQVYNLVDLTHTGPLSKTVVDFWRMIWQEKVYTVAMVTNLKENKKIKCQQYWPESGSKSYGPFMVTITDQQVFADYTIRLLQLQVSTSIHRDHVRCQSTVNTSAAT